MFKVLTIFNHTDKRNSLTISDDRVAEALLGLKSAPSSPRNKAFELPYWQFSSSFAFEYEDHFLFVVRRDL